MAIIVGRLSVVYSRPTMLPQGFKEIHSEQLGTNKDSTTLIESNFNVFLLRLENMYYVF